MDLEKKNTLKFLKKCFKASFLIILLILHKEVMNIWNQLEGAVPNDTRNIDPENVITVLGIYFRIVEKKISVTFYHGSLERTHLSY